MSLRSVADVRVVELAVHSREDGTLVVVQQGKELPFAALRMFTVRAARGATRGRHAHKQCWQFLLCVHGAIEVECDDGTSKQSFTLDSGNKGLLVPPSIWATETYVIGDSVLSVLCDRLYEADDYLRDYEQFLAWRRTDE